MGLGERAGGEQCPQCEESDLRPYGNGSKWACPRCYFIVPCCEGGELAARRPASASNSTSATKPASDKPGCTPCARRRRQGEGHRQERDQFDDERDELPTGCLDKLAALLD